MPNLYEVTLEVLVRQRVQVTADHPDEAAELAAERYDLIGAVVLSDVVSNVEDVTDYRLEVA